MNLPRLCCGTRADLRAMRGRLKKVIREAGVGEELARILDGEQLSSGELGGYLVVEAEEQREVPDGVHYWCDLLVVEAWKAVGDDVAGLTEFCSAILERPWGGLTFLSQESNGLERRVRDFDEKYCLWVLRFVDQVDVGRRFWAGLRPRCLWEMGSGLTGVLGALGASNDELLAVKSVAEYKKLADRLLRARREDR